ncbi:MAG: glycosyltransferase [Zoogloeaceae bacterium]|jgi:glycosyltransferase involved in cell wall biosynthesis|nr:glycosyltransferase [Zoogloeaceae bacterium]
MILQLCHGYDGPFLDCARQYAQLFAGTPHPVVTVYLTGEDRPEVAQASASRAVIFMGYRSAQIRGLKLNAIRDLARIAARHPFTLCIAHRFKPVYTALWGTKLPVIGVHHAFGDYRRFGRRLLARLFRQRLALLGVSNAVRDDLRASLPTWSPARIATLYNRVDVTTLQRAQLPRNAARQTLDLPLDAWIVGHVGRLHPDKDQATLLRAFALARPALPPESLLVIVGSGRLENALKAQAAALGIAAATRFPGQIAEARRYFRAFDCFALSSDHEPFGMVLLEAMAADVPIICSDCGGAPEVVGETGRCFPFGNAEALGRALIDCAAAPPDGVGVAARLHDLFSDAAVRQAFWQLPLLRDLGITSS